MNAFRALLRALPRALRDGYGEEMEALFRDRLQRARARGVGAVLRVWATTAADLARSGWAERTGRSALREGERTHGAGGSTNGWKLDLRYALRRLVRAPVFSISAALILAIGIGANTAAFSVVDALLLRPPPFARPDEVVFVYQDSDDGEPSSAAYPAYLDIAERGDVFAGVAATSPETAVWETEAGPRPASVAYATSSFLPVLGLEPSRGRWFAAEHDQVGAGLFAVVSHRTWRAELGADPGVLGRVIRLNGQPVTVIGVGPERFNGAGGALVTDFWLSVSTTPVGGEFRVANLERRQDHWYDLVARLAPGVSHAEAQAAMDALALRMGETYPELDRGRGLTVFGSSEVRFHPEVDGVLLAAGAGLMGVVGLVLLLACGNLANLLLVRGVAQGRELAVRQALGAARARLARLVLLEALVLATSGAALGILLARALVGLLPRLPLPLPAGATLDVALDGRVLAFAALLAVATALLFGLLPASRAGRNVAGALRDDSRSASEGRAARRLRGGLVAVQVAASLVLLVGAGLLGRSLASARAVDPGFDPGRVAILAVNPSQSGVPAADAALALEAFLERVRTLPEVEAAAFTTRLPAAPGGSTTTVVEGYEPEAGTDAVEIDFAYVSRDFFEALGVPVVAGRGLGPDDRPESPRVVVVNETAAERFWGGDAVGRRLRPQGAPDAWIEVVGVVRDTKVRSLREPPTPMIFFAAEQAAVSCCAVVARTAGDPAALLPLLRETLAQAAPALSPSRLLTLEAHLGQGLAAARAAALLMGAFSLVALVLATLGVYAVVAFTVQRRAPELGIRIALGAARPRVVAMVVAESMLPVLVGTAAGLAVALLAAPGLEGVIFGVGARDVVAFLGGAGTLLAVGAAAALVPAWRAVRADPVEVLRGG